MMNQDKRHGRIFLLGIIGFILMLTLAGLVMPGPFRLGELSDVSFVALSDGQVLTFNATLGNWTNGYVNGTAVNMTLSELSDVFIDSIQNNQVIQYNSTSAMWENRDLPSSSDSYAVSNLTDVSVVGLTDGQLLRYNDTSSEWENSDETTWYISTLADVSLASLADLQILQYNATSARWENRAIPAQALLELTDVSINSLSNAQILQYNSTTERWENEDLQTWAISTLTDVSVAGLTNGQILRYNSTSGKWENENHDSYAISNLTDVTILGLTDGQILKYNATSAKWENIDETSWAISTLTDVTISGLNNLQILQYNSTSGKWENKDIPAQALSELTDVSLTSLSDEQVIQYNSTSSKWENRDLTNWAISLLADVNITSVQHSQILQYDAVSAKWINVNASNGTYVSANPPWYDSGLVGYWQLNEGSGVDAFDDSGYGNDGVVSGASWVDGEYCKALSFDGNDLVTFGYPVSLQFGTGAFSVSFWLKHDGVPVSVETVFISRYNLLTTGKDHFHVWLTTAGRLFMMLRTNGGTLITTTTTVSSVCDNLFKHVVCGRDSSGNTFIYVNGVKEVSAHVNGGDLEESDNSWAFGASVYWSQYFLGVIDDVRIYNRVLNQTEISTLFVGGLQSHAGQLWLNTTSDVLYVRNSLNSAWNFVSAPIQGFGATTPSFPASETDITNTNPFPVRIYILTIGTTTAYNITDQYGTMVNIETPLYAGMEITLDYLEKIRFTYSAAPTWKFYGCG